MVDTRRNLALKRLNSKHEALVPLDRDNPPDEMDDVLNFYEDVSVMVDHGMVSRYDVWREFSEVMFPFYADARPYIEQRQKDNPSLFGGIVDLMDSMNDQEEKYNRGVSDHPASDDVVDYYVGESRLKPGVPAPRQRATDRHPAKKPTT
jgi:hypothetical protein